MAKVKRISDKVKLSDIPNKIKKQALPPIGTQLAIGPFMYRVTYHNEGKATFTASLIGVKEESRIVNPAGEPAAVNTKQLERGDVDSKIITGS